MLLVSRIFVRFRRQQAQNFRNCVNFSNLKKKILVCLFPTKKMRKSKKIRFWRVRNRQTAQFSWETDKLKIFFEKLKISSISSGHLKGFVKKSIFDDFRAPRNSRGLLELHKILENLPFLAKTPLKTMDYLSQKIAFKSS